MLSDLSLEEIKTELAKKSSEIRTINKAIREATRGPNRPMNSIGNLALDLIALERGQWGLIEELFRRIEKKRAMTT